MPVFGIYSYKPMLTLINNSRATLAPPTSVLADICNTLRSFHKSFKIETDL